MEQSCVRHEWAHKLSIHIEILSFMFTELCMTSTPLKSHLQQFVHLGKPYPPTHLVCKFQKLNLISQIWKFQSFLSQTIC